ncbi:cell division protein FtsZ [Natrarchaeobaculum aegyptiacum]|uniref:Tubulin-like protein CetZ n=1 Tax=Natrarchaeobaculum aegyptiacum TaxID=745377 RepID=A0A2Z2HRU1_9EURY|nr:cell division protein FtsZ [Natrarchaeobaculum aegyptiacum]ARS89799.1 cell division protein FtsZ [Natrarchaeobaculum aegyptiacum]
MQLEVIGVGGAGGRIADAIAAADARGAEDGATPSFVGTAYAFDTDGEAVTALESIPVARRHRYGETIENGLEGNLQEGFATGEEYADELSRQLDAGQPSIADAFLVCVGLGGATGGGTVPALVSNFQRLYDAPVYVLATLPARSELEESADDRLEPRAGGGNATPDREDVRQVRPFAEENAVRTLDRLDGLADAVLCFDNDAWVRDSERLHDVRDRLNADLATRVQAFFAAVADDAGGTPQAESVVDASDVRRILGSETAVATIGYGSQQVETGGGSRFGLGIFASREHVDTGEAVRAVETVIGKALRGRLTLDCEPQAAERALLLVGGPPAWLNRQAIADGRSRLESETGSAAILTGDAPRPEGESVFAVVVLAGVGSTPRLEALREGTRPLENRRGRERDS